MVAQIGHMMFYLVDYDTKQVGDKYLINTRTNYYHKPVWSLNWKWNVDEQSSLSTTFYGSKGRGGGTGPMNTRDTFMGDDGVMTIINISIPAEMSDGSGTIDWTQVMRTINNGQVVLSLIQPTVMTCIAQNESLEHL